MIQKEKQLLIKDLCARLPYGIIIAEFDKYDNQIRKFELKAIGDSGYLRYDAGRDGEQGAALYSKVTHNYCKPYLRPMSSMTEEEKKKIQALYHENTQNVFKDPDEVRGYRFYDISVVDWLNENHFDYRGLIEKGLALEAPEGMYKK